MSPFDWAVCIPLTWCRPAGLINIFETFLPQLLRYPNPADPLNGEAANLLLRDPVAYNKRVADYVRRYASGGAKPPSEPSHPFEGLKEPTLGVRKDSGTTTTTAESVVSAPSAPVEQSDTVDTGYMSDASELSDL